MPLAELARSRPAAQRRLGRSLSIREVDAGSCNGCELEIHALNNAFYDLERFGLRFVASPRHADVLLVTGPVTKNMREALERTYARRPPRNGWWQSAIAPSTAAFSPGPTRSPAASPRSCRSISTYPVAHQRRRRSSKACSHCSKRPAQQTTDRNRHIVRSLRVSRSRLSSQPRDHGRKAPRARGRRECHQPRLQPRPRIR